jgi:hypothetical protein
VRPPRDATGRPSRVTAWLRGAPPAAFSAWAIGAAFAAYFSMYAFRKPFAAATFSEQTAFGTELKIALVLSQVIGYALSKFVSIKLVSEIPAHRRALALVALVLVAELALLAFGVLPPAGQVVAIFFNGVPLGAVWGLVFGHLEGRRTTEILGAGLSTSYIVASGAVKSVGRWLLDRGVDESWMPFLTGLLFLPPFLLAVWALRVLPPPSPEDVEARSERAPMYGAERKAFVARFAFGLIALTGLYMFLTAFRDFRDNFAVEIWAALGWADTPAIFTYSEIPVALAVLAGLAALYLVRDNRKAFFAVHWLMIGGSVLIGVATLAFDLGLLGGVAWMIALGVGLYLGYVPYGCMLFDRLIAATRAPGTAVFMIYVTDAFGYLGSIIVLVVKHSSDADLSWLAFFRGFAYTTAIVCTAAFAASAWYFARRTRATSATSP